MLASAVYAQCSNILNVIVLHFRAKALFYSYGVIRSPLTLLWHIPDFLDDQPARSGSCIFKLRSIQLQLQEVKLSKQAN